MSTNSISKFTDHPIKEVIRKNWCKELLNLISSINNKNKGTYLGLPGVEAIDIKEWIDYIEKVIAFQCRIYGEPSSKDQDTIEIEKLQKTLDDLEISGKLKSYSLYDGWIEEVMFQGCDITGQKFIQNEQITIYNLDFCNQIATPLKIIDTEGELHKVYKFDALKKLLTHQNKIFEKRKKGKFVLFLTVHEDVFKNEKIRFFNDLRTSKKFKTELLKNNIDKTKLYVIKNLQDHCKSNSIKTEFLNPIHYKGSGNTKLLLFTLLGTYEKNASSCSEPFQNLSDIHKLDIIKIESNKFVLHNKEIQLKELFQNSETKKLWKK